MTKQLSLILSTLIAKNNKNELILFLQFWIA